MAWTPFNFFKYDPERDDFGKTAFNIKQALNNNWDHAQQLITELRSKTSTNDFDDAYKQKLDNTPDDTNTALADKANKATYTETVMLASKWNKTTSTYSFEDIYPAADYDIEIGPSDDATIEQMQAYGAALIPINSGANVAVAKGEIPTVDIPLAIKVVRK